MKENKLVEFIVESILEKKGKDIFVIDLSSINFAYCDYFIVCHGNSKTQVNAIAESVEDKLKNELNVRLGHIEGVENAQWILMDYSSVVVHIFQKEYRDYYKLEELWGDAVIQKVNIE